MEWFKHITDSKDDPDIMEAEDIFGDAGYSVFFKTLEVYGREYNSIDSQGNLRINQTILARKLRKRWTKVELILNFYQEKGRIFLTKDEERDNFVFINIPKFIKIASNWTKRTTGSPTEAPTEAPTAKEVEVEKKKNKKKKNTVFLSDSPQYFLAKRLHDAINERAVDYKYPDLQKEALKIDEIIRLDKMPTEKIRHVIDWCQADDFWQNNILSATKLRKQFMQLNLKMGSKPGGYVKKHSPRTIKNISAAKGFLNKDQNGGKDG